MLGDMQMTTNDNRHFKDQLEEKFREVANLREENTRLVERNRDLE